MEKRSLNERLLSIQGEIESMTKEKSGYKFNYVEECELNKVLKPLFDKYKVLFYPSVVDVTAQYFEIPTKEGDIDRCNLFTVKCIMVFEANGERLSVEYYGADKNGLEDGLQSAITSARRSFLLKFFNIIQEDKRGGNTNQRPPQQQRQYHQNQKPPLVQNVISESDLLIQKLNQAKTLAEFNSLLPEVKMVSEKDKSIKKTFNSIAEQRGYSFDLISKLYIKQ